MKDAKKVQSIIEALELAELPIEDQESILLTLNDLVFRGALVRLVEQMNEPQETEFTALIARHATEDELAAFLATIPGSDIIVKETIEDLHDDILSVTK